MYSVPLVGVWVKGVRSVLDPIVYAACLRYAFASGLPDRATQQQQQGAGGGPFLLLIYSNGEWRQKDLEV